ncbi:thiol-disulfide oxidoreductase DCC family protein [uncultured Tenacibaculum sp.]|uniref:thiol-disulfide oxidoreductase DCC family protein n=1 Tax=uncultured Tenacibaculum sp. TaxID=174713 RepID=UPI002637115D|nr:thiol-disulfide oxidoreductase DCC family protein [uncultured Tenacibaculum sp.]
MLDFPADKKIIIFDGVCNLCNQSVLKVIKLDKKNAFLFTSLQSEIGKEVLEHLKIDTSKIDSIILFDPKGKYYIKSSAALKIMSSFNGFWKLTQIFWLIPKALRNLVYDFIAKNRYKWFGKKDQCMIPTPELTSKFLS